MADGHESGQQDEDNAQDELTELRGKLVSRLEKALRRQEGKLRKLSTALGECANEEEYRRCGELLKANLSKLRRGQSKVKVIDYYSNGQQEIEIKVARNKTPLENMEAYFRRARKLRSGRPRIEREIELTQEAISELEGLHTSVADACGIEELEALAAQVNAALAPKKPKKIKGKPRSRLGPKRFVSSGGYEILVGRNQRQNDRLTLTIARGSDLFMHSGGSPGSHVIIRAGGKRDFPRQTMLEAANLAVYYSKLRNSRYAEVSYTQVKNVSKPRGAKPGLVYLSRHKVLGVEPDEEMVKMLHENAKEL
jgi:predicted ribosome quality control (RQC) complex YloA/Tae2 family protein